MLTPTDSVIFLRPLRPQNAAAHLAGEDDAIATWLSGGRSTASTVRLYIARSDAQQMVIRTAPANRASIRVAEKAGFKFRGTDEETNGRMKRYVLDLR